MTVGVNEPPIVSTYRGGFNTSYSEYTKRVIDRLRVLSAQAAVSNPVTAQPLIAPSAWVAATVYKPGQSVVNGGNCYIALIGGTSAGSGGPAGTGNAAIVDGTVTWYYDQPSFSSNANAPTYTPATSASVVGSSGNFWSNSASSFNAGAAQIRDTSKFLLNCALWTETGGTQNTLTTNNQAQNPTVSFVTDAPLFAIVANGGSQWNSTIYVDGVPLTLGFGSATPISGSQFYHQLQFATRKARVITYEMLNQQQFYGVLCSDKISKVYQPSYPNTVCTAIVGTSYIGGSNQHPVTNSLGIGEQIGKLLGCNDCFVDSLGSGTGYVSAGSNGTFLSRLPNIVAYAPDLLIVTGGGINDRNAGATAASEQAAIQTYIAAARVALPKAVIIVVGAESGATGPAANVFTMEASANAAVLNQRDPNTFYISQSDVSGATAWLSGTGTTAATNASGNSDLYVGVDGIHPVHAGTYYLAKRHAQAIYNLIGSLTI